MNGQRDQRLIAVFQRSMTLTVALAAVILSVAEGAFFPAGVTPLVAVFAWHVVDRRRLAWLPVAGANVLGALAFLAAAQEFRSQNIEAKLLSGAHLIVYLSWIVLLMRKATRQHWWLLTLSVLQIAVASVLTSSAMFGSSLLVVMLLMIWTLSVFSLLRIQERFDPAGEPSGPASAARGALRIRVRNGLQLDAQEPWINRRLRGFVLFSFAGSLALSLIVFALFPRVWIAGSPFAEVGREDRRRATARTGFSETVSLGNMSEVLQSNNRALQFEIEDAVTGEPVTLEDFRVEQGIDEIRFRGNALGQYFQGKWHRGFADDKTDRFGTQRQLSAAFRLTVTQDPPIGQYVFAVHPLTQARSRHRGWRILQWKTSGVLSWDSRRSRDDEQRFTPTSYAIDCPSLADYPDATFEHWSLPAGLSPEERLSRLARFRYDVRRHYVTRRLSQQIPELFRITSELCGSGPDRLSERECVEAIQAFLSTNNGFAYSLSNTRQDTSIDPVEDFVLNTKTGNCEYYASACTLMLQSARVPARIVSGYLGSELNTVSGRYEVRQKHAHSWVEAFVDNRWITIDPTPSSQRQQLAASTGSLQFLEHLKLAISDIWSSGFQNITLEQQQSLFAPLINLAKSVWRDIQERGLWNALLSFGRSLFTSPEKWFSWQGGVVTFVLLLLAALLARLRLPSRIAALVARLRRHFGAGERATRTVIRFYERFAGLCESHGLTIAPSATALETARAATDHFRDRLQSQEQRAAPRLIASAFNDVRFGHITLSRTRADHVGEALAEFTRAISTPRDSQ